MWPGLKSHRRRHKWVEFVVGSNGFSPVTPAFSSSQKPIHFQIQIRPGMVDEEPLRLCANSKSEDARSFYTQPFGPMIFGNTVVLWSV